MEYTNNKLDNTFRFILYIASRCHVCLLANRSIKVFMQLILHVSLISHVNLRAWWRASARVHDAVPKQSSMPSAKKIRNESCVLFEDLLFN